MAPWAYDDLGSIVLFFFLPKKSQPMSDILANSGRTSSCQTGNTSRILFSDKRNDLVQLFVRFPICIYSYDYGP